MNVDVALQILLALINRASTLSAAIGKAREEGRDDLTTEELQKFRDQDDAAKADLQSLIDKGS